MKLLVISDSHRNITNLKAVMEIGKKADIKAVIHCGDWDNVEAVKVVFDFGIPLYAVLGNADVDPEIEEFLKFNAKKFEPNFLKTEIGGRKIGVIHEAKVNNPKFAGLDIIFSGHLHSQESKMINFQKFVRPGAIINGINFAIYETETNEVQFIKDVEI